MHTAQDGDRRLAELWDKNMEPRGWMPFGSVFYDHRDEDAFRKFASDLVDGKFQALKAERDAALKELAALKAADVPDTQPEHAETEDERNGREAYEEWCAGDDNYDSWDVEYFDDPERKKMWIAFAKRRPKVVPPAPKLREPGQVLLESLASEGFWIGGVVDNLADRVDRVARKLGIEAQP